MDGSYGLAVGQVLKLCYHFLPHIHLDRARGSANRSERVGSRIHTGTHAGIKQSRLRNAAPTVCFPRTASRRTHKLNGIGKWTQSAHIARIHIGRQARLDLLHLGDVPAIPRDGVRHLQDPGRHLRRIDGSGLVEAPQAGCTPRAPRITRRQRNGLIATAEHIEWVSFRIEDGEVRRLRFKGELHHDGIRRHELGGVRILRFRCTQPKQRDRSIEIDAATRSRPAILNGQSPRSVALQQVGGCRKAAFIESPLRGIPIEGPIAEVGSGKVDVEPLDESTGTRWITYLKAHISRPTSTGWRPIVGHGKAKQFAVEGEIQAARLGGVEVEIVDDGGVTRLVRNGITAAWRGRRRQNFREIRSDDQLRRLIDAQGNAIALAHDFIAHEVHQIGLRRPVRCVAPCELINGKLPGIVCLRTIGTFSRSPLDAHHGRDAQARFELADVHLHFIRGLE